MVHHSPHSLESHCSKQRLLSAAASRPYRSADTHSWCISRPQQPLSKWQRAPRSCFAAAMLRHLATRAPRAAAATRQGSWTSRPHKDGNYKMNGAKMMFVVRHAERHDRSTPDGWSELAAAAPGHAFVTARSAAIQ